MSTPFLTPARREVLSKMKENAVPVRVDLRSGVMTFPDGRQEWVPAVSQ